MERVAHNCMVQLDVRVCSCNHDGHSDYECAYAFNLAHVRLRKVQNLISIHIIYIIESHVTIV